VSLRGSSPQQVGVFLDGVPVTSSMAGLIDVADLPLDGMSRVEIHRGWVPIAFGAGAIGGALNLVSTDAEQRPRARIDAGLGSFWTRQAAGEIATRTRRLAIGVRAGYAGSEGNYRYYDDGGTAQLTGDDRTRRRTGNGYDRLLAQLRLDGRVGRWRLGAHQLVVAKRAGVPGPGSAQAHAALLDQLLARSIFHARREQLGGPGGRLEWLASFGVEARRFADPRGEIGLGVDDQRTLAFDVYVSPRWRTPLWRGAYLMLLADHRSEWIGVDQRIERSDASPSGDAQRRRHALGAGIELEQFLWDDRLHVVPAVRVDAVASAFAVPDAEGEQDDRGRDRFDASVSPRLGTRLSVTPWLSLRGSIGRYFRTPSLVELFGDRGYFVGNEGLQAERGLVADGGFVIDASGAAGEIYAHAAGFWVRSRELIQWISAGTVARPENVAAARVRGFEGSVSLRSPADALELMVHYTLIDAADRSGDPTRQGHALPGRPRHDLFVRGSFGWVFHPRGTSFEPRIGYTVELVARTFLDPSGRYVLPPRALQAIGIEGHVAGRVHLAFEVRNLLDVRTASVTLPIAHARPSPVAVTDYIGYPLPGRSVWATVRIDFALARRKATT
jgi:outer membrane receptor protein involved in Fe transport